MTTYERTFDIIAGTLLACKHDACTDQAHKILRALQAKKIMPTTMKASPDMFTRFHAHCRFVGNNTGAGYEHFYNASIAYAVEQDSWPVKMIEKIIDIDGHKISVDIQVPQSSHRATNKQLLTAYTVIEDAAKEAGLVLPENTEEAMYE